MNAGKGDLKLVSNISTLNDGHFHSVNVVKSGRKIELLIDEIVQAKGTLPQKAVVLHAMPLSMEGNATQGLFLGGFPSDLNDTDITNQHIACTIPLRGAIKELVFDGE